MQMCLRACVRAHLLTCMHAWHGMHACIRLRVCAVNRLFQVSGANLLGLALTVGGIVVYRLPASLLGSAAPAKDD